MADIAVCCGDSYTSEEYDSKDEVPTHMAKSSGKSDNRQGDVKRAAQLALGIRRDASSRLSE